MCVFVCVHMCSCVGGWVGGWVCMGITAKFSDQKGRNLACGLQVTE